ncbi:penicillin-binding protein 1C [Leptospira wolffii]|uniref:penicillin-binding protein 1C n=1 Tax=Leptospira wolffii TaxID=409998 RepID=UPI001438427F|nr:penicillin-binding protein 1C [Leptospira wolffii]
MSKLRFLILLVGLIPWASDFAVPVPDEIREPVDSGSVPNFYELRRMYRPSEGILLDRNGQTLQVLRLDKTYRRLEWTTSSDVPEIFILALLAQEDRRFPFHNGVDYKALLGSLKDRILGNSKRGASTISMQLAGFLLETKPGGRSFSDKIRQMRTAWILEENWSKAQIAEAYWNFVPFKGEWIGLRAASRGIFGVDPSSLAPEQSVLLVSLLPNPNLSLSKWGAKACSLAAKVGREDLCESILSTVSSYKRPMSVWNTEKYEAYHAAHRIFRKAESSLESQTSGKIRSTIDSLLQRKAEIAMDRILLSIREKNVREAGILALDNRSGAVLVYLGNSKLSPENYFVDSVQARRQAGSTLKPFLYALAFETGILEPDSILYDRPREWELLGGSYKPANYEEKYWGAVPAKTALASSLNIPAVQVLDWVGVPRFVSELKELGFQRLEGPDHYGLSLALGTADINLWELTNAYRTLANDGYRSDPTFFPEEALQNSLHWESSKESSFLSVLDPKAVEKVKGILSSRDNRAPGFGWESNLATRFYSFAKTGTSQDMRDNWCVGSTANYTVGVWVGNMSGEPMHDVSGITGAAPLWKEIVEILEDHKPSEKVFAKEDSDIKSTLEIGNFPFSESRILYPETGNLFALDPEIPSENERIRFRARSSSKELEWILNGKHLAKTKNSYLDWKPKRGNYLLSVRDESGRLSETVAFQVR